MSKQGEIIGKLTIVCQNEKVQPEKPERFAQSILWYLKAWGVVLKDDRNLPNEIHTPDGNLCYFEELIR